MSSTTDLLSAFADPHRMQVLASIDFDDVELRAKLDAVTARTTARLGLPTSMVTLVLDSAQVVVGSHGVSGWVAASGGTPTEWAFCANVVRKEQPYVVPDAANDPVQRNNPLVTDVGFGSYAGVPLVVDGEVLGAHCVLDDAPHTFTEAEMAELRSAAAEIVALLQQHRVALD